MSTVIERLNARFAIVGVGNTVVVMELLADGSIKELWPFAEFKRLLIKHSVNTGSKEDPKIVPLADYWLKHRKGQQYERLVFAMPGSIVTAGEHDYNGWRGYTVVPTPGDWSKNKAHWKTVVCSGNEEHFLWTFNWCAALAQKPGQHAWAAIVLCGGQGIGKGHFADKMLGAIFHKQQYLHLLGANQLTAEFNEHLSGKALVYADESTWGGDKQAASKLKGLVTESTVAIHRKFLKMVEEPSALHIIIASNNEWPIPIEWDDRRFFVLDVSGDQKQRDSYFADLLAELENGGRAAMLHDLLQHEVNWAALRHPPVTDAKRNVKALSLSHEELWLQNWLMNDAGDWRSELPRTQVYAAYIESFKRTSTRPKSIDGLGKFLKTIFKRVKVEGQWPRCGKLANGERFIQVVGENTFRRVPGVELRVNSWRFPDLQKCRNAFDSATGTSTEWPEIEAEQQELRAS